MADPIIEEYKKIRSTPSFSKMSYPEQREFWSVHLMETLSKSPTFLNMPDEEKLATINDYALVPPALQSKQAERYMDNIELGALNGDLKAKGLMLTNEQSGRLYDRSLLVGLPLKVAAKAKGLGEDLAIRLSNWITGRDDTREQLGMAGGPLSEEAIDDQIKMSQYYGLLYDEANKGKWLANVLSTMARAAPTEMVDLIPMYTAFIGSIKQPVGIAKSFTGWANKKINDPRLLKWASSKSSKWYSQLWAALKNDAKLTGLKALRAGGHSAAGGLLGVIREGIIEGVNRVQKDPSFQEVMEGHLKHFTTYALGDLVGFIIGGSIARGLGFFAKQTKATFIKPYKGFGKVEMGPLTLSEYEGQLWDLLAGRNIPDETILGWPKELQDELLSARAFARMGKLGVHRLHGLDRLRVAGKAKGFTLSEVGTGEGTKLSFVDSIDGSTKMSARSEMGAWSWLAKQMREGIPANDLKRHMMASHNITMEEIVKVDPTEASWIANQNFEGSFMQNADGTWTTFSPKETLRHQNFDDVALYIFRNSIDENTFREHLNELGLKLMNDAEGGYSVALSNGQPVAKGQSIAELIGYNEEWMPKLPAKSMPTATVVDDSMDNIIFRGDGVATGPADKILESLNRIQDPAKGNMIEIPVGNGSIKFKAKGKQWIAHVPELGMKKPFKSMTEARRYITGEWKEFDNVVEAANFKGMHVTSLGHQWMVSGRETNYVLGSWDDVVKKVGEVPFPDAGPELSGLEAGVGVEFGQSLDFTYKPKHYGKLFETGKVSNWRWYWRDKIAPVGDQINYAYERNAVPRNIYDGYTDVLQALDAFDGRVGDWEPLLNSAKLGSNGKEIPKSIRKQSKILFGVEPGSLQWNRIIEENGFSDDVVQMYWKIHKTWGLDPDSGLFAHFGMPLWKFERNYMTHIKEFIFKGGKKKMVIPDGEMKDLLQQVFSGSPHKSVSAYFEKARISEIATELVVEDPIDAIKFYISRGYRSKYVYPVLNRFTDDINNAVKAGTIKQEGVFATLSNFVQTIGGTPPSVSEAQLAAMGKTILKVTAKGVTAKTQRNWLHRIMGRVYGAALAFRPWAIIRNTGQPWGELSWRVGPKYVAKALNYLDDHWDEAVKEFRAAGLVRQRMPVYSYETVLPKAGRITKAGLNPYTNADLENRLISHFAGKFKFQDGLKAYRAKTAQGLNDALTQKTFYIDSGLEQMPQALIDRIRPMLKSGNSRGAGWLVGAQWAYETQFPYRRGFASGPLRSGTIGTLYGQLGHYSIFRVQNWRNGIGRAIGPHRKILAASKAVGTASALYLGHKHIAGIDAKNYLPWLSTDLSGGPYWELFTTLLQAALGNPADYKTRQARAEWGFVTKDKGFQFDPTKLIGQGKWLIPGSFQMNSILKGMKAANEGDYHRMLVNFLGASPVPE